MGVTPTCAGVLFPHTIQDPRSRDSTTAALKGCATGAAERGRSLMKRVVLAGLLSFLSALLLAQAPAPQAQPPVYEAYAIRFGVLPQFRVSGLVEGADRAGTLRNPRVGGVV